MSFDPNSFLDLQVVGSNDTKLVPIPIGEYPAVTGDVEIVPWQSKDDSTKSGLKAVIQLHIDSSATTPLGDTVQGATGRDKNIVRYEAMLDLLPDGKGLDMGKGKNVTLGRLREAINLNDPNTPFSFRQIPGRPLKVMVSHREYKGDLFAEVKAVTKLA
jgi:hypothetical protein